MSVAPQSPLIPPPDQAAVWIDFDGTITQQDVLDELIKRYAIDGSWRAVEREWQEGTIGSGQCLSRQLAVVRVTDEQLVPFIDVITIDRGFVPLVRFLRDRGVPITILSDGIDRFIARVLQRAGVDDLPFRSNGIIRDGAAMQLRCPHGDAGCLSAAAHCKCSSIANLTNARRGHIYIGDGRSDLCPSRRVDCRFAKGVLALNLEREALAHLAYSTLNDVLTTLQAAWDAPADVARACNP